MRDSDSAVRLFINEASIYHLSTGNVLLFPVLDKIFYSSFFMWNFMSGGQKILLHKILFISYYICEKKLLTKNFLTLKSNVNKINK